MNELARVLPTFARGLIIGARVHGHRLLWPAKNGGMSLLSTRGFAAPGYRWLS